MCFAISFWTELTHVQAAVQGFFLWHFLMFPLHTVDFLLQTYLSWIKVSKFQLILAGHIPFSNRNVSFTAFVMYHQLLVHNFIQPLSPCFHPSPFGYFCFLFTQCSLLHRREAWDYTCIFCTDRTVHLRILCLNRSELYLSILMRSRADTYEPLLLAHSFEGTAISLKWLCVDYNFNFGNIMMFKDFCVCVCVCVHLCEFPCNYKSANIT